MYPSRQQDRNAVRKTGRRWRRDKEDSTKEREKVWGKGGLNGARPIMKRKGYLQGSSRKRERRAPRFTEKGGPLSYPV